MATTTKRASVSRVSVSLNPGSPKRQTADTINKLMAQVLGRAGCEGCGRIAYIDVHIVGDPDPDIASLGGISMNVETR